MTVAAAHALEYTYAHLRRYAETATLADTMVDFDHFGDIVGLTERYADDARYQP